MFLAGEKVVTGGEARRRTDMKRLTGNGIATGLAYYERLRDIENILGDEYDLERLREMVEADREQRCFVFRFGFGSTVYRTWIHPSGSPTFITENKMNTLNDLLNAETWDNAYSTRAEAEAALRREQDGE